MARHAAAACAISTRTGSRTTAGRATNTSAPTRTASSVRGHEVVQELTSTNYFLPKIISCPHRAYRVQPCRLVRNTAAPALPLVCSHSSTPFSLTTGHPRLAVSRIHQFQLFLLSARPPRQLFCGLCRRCLLFEGGQCAHRCHCRPRCFLHLLCWLRRWPVGLSEDFL